jgi:hypothetical protein
MSIVVFWLTPEGMASHAEFGPEQLVAALKFGEERRREGRRHVCVSSEFADRVGPSGVDAVESGRLPSGEPYRFSKAHRGAGPSYGAPASGQQPQEPPERQQPQERQQSQLPQQPQQPQDTPDASIREIGLPPDGSTARLELPLQARGLVMLLQEGDREPTGGAGAGIARSLRSAGLASLQIGRPMPQAPGDASLLPAATGEVPASAELAARAESLRAASHWAAQAQDDIAGLRQGVYASGAAAGAALVEASRPGNRLAALVSCAGRPDLAGEAALAAVVAPTLLIVGESDAPGIEANEWAYGQLACEKKLLIVTGAGPGFVEAGPRQLAVREAIAWFERFLG